MSSTIIIGRLIVVVAVLGLLAVPMVYFLCALARQDQVAAQPVGDGTIVQAAAPLEAWPICSSMDSMLESSDWAALDPDFAAGKRAIAAGDWKGAIRMLTSAGLRDDRNADIENYLGYAHRGLRQPDEAMRHYQHAITLNHRHRGAHEHLGEAFLMQGDLAKAEEHLAALEQICILPCKEYDDLKRAVAEYSKIARQWN